MQTYTGINVTTMGGRGRGRGKTEVQEDYNRLFPDK